MRMLAAVAIVAGLAGGLVGPALAADLPVRPREAPVMVTPYDWTGFYAGVHAGWAQAETRYTFNTIGFFNTDFDQGFKHNPSGALAGGHLGYNWQWGAVVVGIEGSGAWSDVKADGQSPLAALGADVFETKVRWLATLTPRFAIANLNWLFYMKGGVAFAEIESLVSTTAFPGVSSDGKDTRVGWTIGFGIETTLWSPNWVVGVEGNYYDFGGFNVSDLTGAPPGALTNQDVETTMWSVLGRISYRFGGPARPVVARY